MHSTAELPKWSVKPAPWGTQSRKGTVYDITADFTNQMRGDCDNMLLLAAKPHGKAYGAGLWTQ